MRRRHLLCSVFMLAAAVALSLGIAAPAWAASAGPTAASADASIHALPATSLAHKVILPDTSIDGPTLDSAGNESVLAWTGTDAAHHLNVETSTDGLHYGHKLILDESSPFRPDVTVTPVQASFVVALAWTGTDASHTLNVLFDIYGSHPKKLTLWGEQSFAAPALTLGPCFCLAWAGTDAHHLLNVLPLTVTTTGIVPGAKAILSQDSSDAGPHLRLQNGVAPNLNLLWAARGSLQLRIATSTHANGLEPGTIVAGETSAAAPDAFVNGPPSGLGNQEWIGWTGTDPAHHLNLFPFVGNPAPTKTILGDTALGGPALSFNTALNENLLAWTGTDPAHHLNIAGFV